ncbi:UNKNOWN [Stylonychia lemnae]|uniref:Uncharacterized protein n=1 Tax=Stylonychia lemnae TaxID=5949 RepID=A0A078ABD7_STYLE|nr:UNKNOWN [Stylonychia lemnae]|eukprot:CDW79484.1 UNKNOWN [Stylonychia lemnae]
MRQDQCQQAQSNGRQRQCKTADHPGLMRPEIFFDGFDQGQRRKTDPQQRQQDKAGFGNDGPIGIKGHDEPGRPCEADYIKHIYIAHRPVYTFVFMQQVTGELRQSCDQ